MVATSGVGSCLGDLDDDFWMGVVVVVVVLAVVAVVATVAVGVG